MNTLQRKWTLDLIHHSHTDIGYTERQEKVKRYHIHFIKQVIHILNKIHSGEKPQWKGFKWVCETFWAVELFLREATEAEATDFAKYVRSGEISLSGTYLNMTELADAHLIRQLTKRSTDYGKSIQAQVDSAMTADINGYGWGYAQCLLDEGIEHLFTCVHPYHGMFPLGKKQTPFWWETNENERLLVWSSDHYNLGNDLGLVPNALHSYVIRDEFITNFRMDLDEQWNIMEHRIFRYLQTLEEEGYPYDFVPIAISGLIVDNAPPNPYVMEWFSRWNEKYGESVSIEMTTLSDFFHKLKQVKDIEIPIYRGDWPDWWSDGIASTANSTKIFRDANRQLALLKALGADKTIISTKEMQRIEDQLALYAEHTWGYSHSVLEPWNSLTQMLRARKETYASEASRLVYEAVDKVQAVNGEALIWPERALRYKVIYPFSEEANITVYMYIDYWEYPMLEDGFEVRDEQTGDLITHQVSQVSRGYEIAIQVQLAKQEERTYILVPLSKKSNQSTSSFDLMGSDRVKDVVDLFPVTKSMSVVNQNEIETDYLKITWEIGVGVTSWFDKQLGIDLLGHASPYTVFTPVYEVTPVSNEEEMYYQVRTNMGRNKKGMNVERSSGKLIEGHVVTEGPLWYTIVLRYEVEGLSHYCVQLKVDRNSTKVDVSVRFHKASTWEPENVYISLPFQLPSAELWLAKTGAYVRAGVDQLPGTCLDYYSIQEGFVWANDDAGVAISSPDAPLLQVGLLDYGIRKLMGQQNDEKLPIVYSWTLNNVWETNFHATLGGFYEFNYVISSSDALRNIEAAFAECRRHSQRALCFRS